MPAATTKGDLIAVTEKEFAKFSDLLDRVPKDARKKVFDGTSVKDVVGHRAHWIELFLGWHSDGQAGKPVHFPAPGYNWGDLKRYNEDLRARQAELSWAEVRVMLDAAHTRLVDFLTGESPDALYGGPMKGGRNAWTTGRWAEAAGASHYRSAGRYVRAALRDFKQKEPA